ncbi:MAG: hypothetical protein KBD14_00100 [Candidatus Pacebacteria bacterium]|nr:hypothetical protein [Candidatus Paceibacterota bacterium]
MAKRKEQNPFDEQSQSSRKGHNKEQKLKFSLNDFKKLPKEKQIEIAKKQANSEEGFAHPYILDIYNESIVGDIGSTGKSSSYKKAPKPDANGNTEKTPNNKNEIKDLNQLATFKGDFPESAPVNKKAQEIKDKRKKNAEARNTAIKKAGNLDPKEGEDTMQNALAGVVKKEEAIIATTKEQVDNARAIDETPTQENEETINTTETKQPTKAEMLAQLQEIQKQQQQNAEEVAKLKEEKARREKEIEKIKNTEDASLEDEEELLQPIDLEDDGIVKPINLEDDESKNSKEIKQKVNNKTLEISKVRELVDIKIGSVSAAEGRELTIQEQADITREIYLQELEAFNKAKAEKMGIFKKALIKTENWWLGIDNDGNKVEQSLTSRAGKVALATAITSVGAFMTGDVSRLISRVGYATGISTVINTALTSNKVQEILKRFSKTKTENTEEEEDKKLIQKIFNKKNTIQGIISGAAIGTTFMLSGGIMAIVTGGGIICRKLINHYIDEKTNKIRNRPKDEILIENDFDINTFINELNLHEQSEIKFAKFIKNGERIKSLLNTSLSIGIGITSLEVGLHKEIDNETLEVKSVENHVNNEEGNISEETTGKSWWGKALDKIKSFSQGDTDQETTKVDRTLLDKDQKPILEDTKAEGDKIDIKTIKPESIIDSQKNLGETYVYRSLIRSDSELAEKLAKYQGLNLDKVDDDRYMANYLKKLAIKLGRMDNEGHEIRYNQKAIGDISLKLDVDKDGKLISYEIDKEGVVKDVHHEGDSFEKDLEDYEESKLQKTYSKINEAYEKNEGLVKPERIVSTEDDPFSNSYLNEDDSREYFENQYTSGKVVKPDEIDDDNIVAPEKINNTYKLEDIKDSQDWAKLKDSNLKDFFDIGKVNMNEEQIKIAESLRAFYKQALEISNNDEDFQDFVRNNPKLTIGEATALYKDVIENGDFADDLKEKYHFYDWKDSLSRVEVKSETMKEMEKIAKDNFKGKFSQSELKSVNRFYEKNLSLIIKEDRDAWYEYKDQSASDYLKTYKDDHDDFTNFLRDLKKVTGLKPNNGFLGLGHKEQIDEYIMRATMKAKLDGRLDEINLFKKTTIIEENQNDAENYEDYRPYDPSKNTENSLKPSKVENIKTEVKNETEDYNEYKPYDPSKNTENSLKPSKAENIKTEVKNETEDYNEYKPYDPSKNKGGDDLYRQN